MSSAASGSSYPPVSPASSPILRGDDDTISMANAAFSTDDRPTGHEATGDLVEHEQTFERFLAVLAIGLQHAVSCVLGLAIGGLEGHWLLALIYIALATTAALAGVFNKGFGLRPGTAVLALEIFTWLVLS